MILELFCVVLRKKNFFFARLDVTFCKRAELFSLNTIFLLCSSNFILLLTTQSSSLPGILTWQMSASWCRVAFALQTCQDGCVKICHGLFGSVKRAQVVSYSTCMNIYSYSYSLWIVNFQILLHFGVLCLLLNSVHGEFCLLLQQLLYLNLARKKKKNCKIMQCW